MTEVKFDKRLLFGVGGDMLPVVVVDTEKEGEDKIMVLSDSLAQRYLLVFYGVSPVSKVQIDHGKLTRDGKPSISTLYCYWLSREMEDQLLEKIKYLSNKHFWGKYQDLDSLKKIDGMFKYQRATATLGNTELWVDLLPEELKN